MKDYDTAIKEAETIVSELETAEALSMSDYQKKAKRATELLDWCEKQLLLGESHQHIPVGTKDA